MEKTPVKTIDMTPTWVALVPAFIAALQDGTPVGKQAAKEELARLAQFADRMNAEQKKLTENDDPDFFYWTARFGVHKDWVADGFELTDARALDMLAHDLGYANGDYELSATVVEAPDLDLIAKEQGYKGKDDPRFLADR